MTVDTRHARSPETWLWFDQALPDTGWARSVRIGIRNEQIDVIVIRAAAEPGDQVQATGLPGLTNLHNHVFQSGMAGLAEECLVWSGARPVDLSCDTVEVDRRWCLVHATHMFVLIDAAQPLRMLEYSQCLLERALTVLADEAGGAMFREALTGCKEFGQPRTGGRPGNRSRRLVRRSRRGRDIIRRRPPRSTDLRLARPAGGRRLASGRQVVTNGRHVAHAETARRCARVLSRILDLGNA